MDSSFTYDDLRCYLWTCWWRLVYTERRVSCEFELWAAGDCEADMDVGMVAGLVVLEGSLGIELVEVAA